MDMNLLSMKNPYPSCKAGLHSHALEVKSGAGLKLEINIKKIRDPPTYWYSPRAWERGGEVFQIYLKFNSHLSN